MKVMNANANVAAAKIMNNAKNRAAAQRAATATTSALAATSLKKLRSHAALNKLMNNL